MNIISMNLVVIVAVATLAVALGIGLYRTAWGNLPQRDPSDGRSRIEPLDVVAFNNLIDPAEEMFLRDSLPPRTFRAIQRLRLRAAIDYVMCANRNAAVLITVGRSIATEDSPERLTQVQQWVNASVHLRLLSFLVLCLLWAKIAFPGLRLALSGVSGLHERLVRQMGVLTRMRAF